MHYGLLDCGLIDHLNVKLNVTAIDINLNANNVYRFNFQNDDHHQTNILAKNLASITVQELNRLGEFDICTISNSCKPFTRQHTNQHLEDEDARTESFNHLITNIIPNLTKKPDYFLIENVKNFEESKAAKRLLKMFNDMNYKIRQFLLSPIQFGIPNSRLRYYCLAKRNEFAFTNSSSISNEYPNLFSSKSCSNCLEIYFKNKVDSNYEFKSDFKLKNVGDYLEEAKLEKFELKSQIIQKYLPAIDVIDSDSQRSCCFTSAYDSYLTGTGSFLLLNNDFTLDRINELKKNELDRSSVRLRKFTPKEIANLMGFTHLSFQLPNDEITARQAYKLIGNSVNVKVISYLFKILLLNV